MSALQFYILITLFVPGAAAALTGCERSEGTFEDTGEEVVQALDVARDTVKDATGWKQAGPGNLFRSGWPEGLFITGKLYAGE